MLKVGITGGIGSGKTTACKLFSKLFDIPIYYADSRAKHLMNFDPVVKQQIKEILGTEAYHNNGRLNRKQVSSIVFKNPNLLKALNSVVHPAVQEDGLKWFKQLPKKYPYAIKEAALLYESKSYITLDKIIVVHVDNETRIQRVIKRDRSKREAVLARIKNQMDQNKKIKMADFLLENDSLKNLKIQIQKLHIELLALSK